MTEIELTELFVDYRKTAERLKEIEMNIQSAVLAAGSTQKVAGVSATFYKPSTEFDYESASRLRLETLDEEAQAAIIAEYATITTKIRWKEVVEALAIPAADVPQVEKPARVVVKF